MTTNYTWSVKNQQGEKIFKEIRAETAEEARNMLLSAGYTDLELREDDIAAVVNAGFQTTNKEFLGKPIIVTTQDRQKARDNPTITFWDAIRKGIQESIWLCLGFLGFGAFQIYRANYISGALAFLALGVWLVFLICMGLPSIYYKKLIYAADWYQWDEVLSLVDMLKAIGWISFVKVPASELIRYRAKAFAGKGQLEQALTEYGQCRGRPDCPDWLYHLFLAGLYTIAKRYDQAIEYNLLAIKERSFSVPWWDLAYRYARYKRDPVRAREAIAEAEKTPAADIAKSFVARCLGVVAYLDSDYTTAKAELEKAMEIAGKVKWLPFKDALFSISRAYLCCALAKMGDMAGAKKNFEMAKEYLEATKEDELLAECRHLIGNS